jgi:hypothetical protein
MPYWEFLIQRETDRAWRPLTTRSLQVSEGKYRIIANTSLVDVAVRTQVFYQTESQPPQLSQKRSQAISAEGMLVVLPFTYLQCGVWHFNCNIGAEQEIYEQLRLKVVPRSPTSDSPEERLRQQSVPVTAIVPLATDRQPEEILQIAVADLEQLLTDLDRPPEPTPVPEAGGIPIEQVQIKMDRPLQLDHEIFYGMPGGSLMVTGSANMELLPKGAERMVTSVRLPQDGSVLAELEQAIVADQFVFQIPLDLPSPPLNHFLMGEVSILNRAGQPLVNCSFTIAYEQPSQTSEILEDPFAIALQIVTEEQGDQAQPGEMTLQEILSVTNMTVNDLDDLPMNSYEAGSYEVVVDD